MSPGVRKDCLFPIPPPPDPNFPRVTGLSERGREAGASIVNREIQLGLPCRRSSGPVEQASQEAVFCLNFSNMFFSDPCPDPPRESLRLHTGPQIFPSLTLDPLHCEFSQEMGGSPLAEVAVTGDPALLGTACPIH